MAAPATRESKPRSAARDAGDGQARNARSVTGPLAGAVLGPTVCGDCERGRWHRTTPTTGLSQRDGGWFGLGGGVFVAEEGLIEGRASMRDVNRASRLSMRELSAAIWARTSWRSSARSWRMALKRLSIARQRARLVPATATIVTKRPALQGPPHRQRCPDSGPGPLPGQLRSVSGQRMLQRI